MPVYRLFRVGHGLVVTRLRRLRKYHKRLKHRRQVCTWANASENKRLKHRRQVCTWATASENSETVRRNVALEAVRVGNYYAEDQEEVYRYIEDMYAELMANTKWLSKCAKLQIENGLSQRYTVAEILKKKHEVDGFDIFVDPDEACVAKQAAEAGEHKKFTELAPGALGELQDGLTVMVASAEGSADPVGEDEVTELLEGCAAAGEVAAAVFCGEHLEAIHSGKIPGTVLTRIFDALKALLRPSARQPNPRLTGPWSTPHPQKGLGQILSRLAQTRKAQEIADGGIAAEHAERVTRGKQVLVQLCATLAHLLPADSEAVACNRRGPLTKAMARICSEQGLHVSSAFAWGTLPELERIGALHSRGRVVEVSSEVLSADQTNGVGLKPLNTFAGELELLEGLAQDKRDRRKKRQRDREPGRATKRRCVAD